MVREIDQHEVRKPGPTAVVHSKIAQWRDMWSACYRIVEDFFNGNDLRCIHQVLERWIPLMNHHLDRPIDNLDKYDMTLYYCDECNGPKEIIHLYMDETATLEGKLNVFVIVNLYEFRRIHRQYCQDFTRNNQMLVDEARGTINLSAASVLLEGLGGVANPASYFKNLTMWQLLFVYTLHAMAHLDVFDTYDHAHYDSHMYVKESPFYRMHFYGQVIRGRN